MDDKLWSEFRTPIWDLNMHCCDLFLDSFFTLRCFTCGNNGCLGIQSVWVTKFFSFLKSIISSYLSSVFTNLGRNPLPVSFLTSISFLVVLRILRKSGSRTAGALSVGKYGFSGTNGTYTIGISLLLYLWVLLPGKAVLSYPIGLLYAVCSLFWLIMMLIYSAVGVFLAYLCWRRLWASGTAEKSLLSNCI